MSEKEDAQIHSISDMIKIKKIMYKKVKKIKNCKRHKGSLNIYDSVI